MAPAGARALQTWNFKLASDTLDAFGRPDSSEDCPCERNLDSSVVQALHLMHADGLQAKLEDKKGRVARLVESEAFKEQLWPMLKAAAVANGVELELEVEVEA